MLILGIRYLQGIAVGSHGDHGQVEWPPHPARVFMAMVAAHYQTGADAEERAALLWLERQPPPDIFAPEALPCNVVTQYVPVNDRAGPAKMPVHSLSITRHRIDRVFARASLAGGDTAVLHWPAAEPPPGIRSSLARLCAQVSRIGHSSSLVQMWLANSVPDGLQHWRIDGDHSTHMLRVPRAGTLDELDRSFNREAVERYAELLLAMEYAKTSKARSAARKKLKADFPNGEPRQDRPRISTYEGYALVGAEMIAPKATGSAFSPHLAIFTLDRVDGPYRSLDLACTLALTNRWREAIASHANDFSPEVQSLLTGHTSDRTALQSTHVAFLALGFVGHPYATGHVPGIALALPGENTMSPDLRREVLRVAGRVSELKLGKLGVWKVTPSLMARPLETLRARTWTAHPDGATHWSTVAPIVYDHHPKSKNKSEYLAEVAAMIRTGCERIGLPQPREVIVTPVSAHLGAPPAHAFPRLQRKDGSERRHSHAILIFDVPVCGPILLGAGRYRGYGLCRPMEVDA